MCNNLYWDRPTLADVCSFFFCFESIFFSASDVSDGRDGDGTGELGGGEGDGEGDGDGVDMLLPASTVQRHEVDPIREFRRLDFSGGRRWPITFPSTVSKLITSSEVRPSSKSKWNTLAVLDATFTARLKSICKLEQLHHLARYYQPSLIIW